MNVSAPSPRALAFWLQENEITIPPVMWLLTAKQPMGRRGPDSETASWVAQWTRDHLGFVSRPGLTFRNYWQTLPWDVVLVGLVHGWSPKQMADAVRAGLSYEEAQTLVDADEDQWEQVRALAGLRTG